MSYTIVENEGCFEVHDARGRECWVASTRSDAEEWIAEREEEANYWPRPRGGAEDYDSRTLARDTN